MIKRISLFLLLPVCCKIGVEHVGPTTTTVVIRKTSSAAAEDGCTAAGRMSSPYRAVAAGEGRRDVRVFSRALRRGRFVTMIHLRGPSDCSSFPRTSHVFASVVRGRWPFCPRQRSQPPSGTGVRRRRRSP